MPSEAAHLRHDHRPGSVYVRLGGARSCRRCCRGALAACLPPPAACLPTLERLQRRLGRRDERPSRHQRLQALTERLLPRPPAATAAATPSPATTPASPPPPPPPPPLPPVPPPRARHRADDFATDGITLARVEPRSIVGSYVQRTIPYRSASFSQGDFAANKYARVQPASIFDLVRRDGPEKPPRVDTDGAEGSSAASVDSGAESGAGSADGLVSLAAPAPRSPPPARAAPRRTASVPAPPPAPPLLPREEPVGSGTSPPATTLPFTFPPLPEPPATACANPDCECADFKSRDDSVSATETGDIPVPVYECIVKQWSTERPQSGAASDGSPEAEREDEPITSEQVASLLAAVHNPRTAAPPGTRERRRPLDKTRRRKGIYITTASDDGGEEEPPARLSADASSSLTGEAPPTDGAGWPRTDELQLRRVRLSQQSSDERDDDGARTWRRAEPAAAAPAPAAESERRRTGGAAGRRSLSDAPHAARPTHTRAASSPSKLSLSGRGGAELLAELLRGSSEALSNAAVFDNVVLTLHQHNVSTSAIVHINS
ncbi:hypothetical protein ACJJTC_017286 [Scirpophaga incertulas]